MKSIKNINDASIKALVNEVKTTIENGGKICVIQRTINTHTKGDWVRRISLAIIRDGSEVYPLEDLVTAMEVAKPCDGYNEFRTTNVGQFMVDFLRQMNIYFGTKYDTEKPEEYYRFIG